MIRYKSLNSVVLPATSIDDPCTRTPTACGDATCDEVTFGLESAGDARVHASADDDALHALEAELDRRVTG